MKKSLILAAIGSLALLGGLVAVEASTLAPQYITANEGAETVDYTLTIDSSNFELSEDAKTATAKTESGYEIGFALENFAAGDDGYILNAVNYGNSNPAKIYCTTAITGIKSITVNYGQVLVNRNYATQNLIYGYRECSFEGRKSTLDYTYDLEYDQRFFWGDDSQVSYGHTFLSDIGPSYFGLMLSGSSGTYTKQPIQSIVIKYSCNPIADDISSITVSDGFGLENALLYYRAKSTVEGTIKLQGDTVRIGKPARIVNPDTGGSKTIGVTLDLNGCTLQTETGNGFSSYSGMLAVGGNAKLTITDTSEDKSGVISTDYSDTTSAAATHVVALDWFSSGDGSSISIEGGTLIATDDYSAVYLDGNNKATEGGATVNISGGTFRNQSSKANSNLLSVMHDGSIAVTGGTFVGFDPVDYLGASAEGIYQATGTVSGGITTYSVSLLTSGIPASISGPATYSLSSDVTLTSGILATGDLSINGNGHTISFGEGTERGIRVDDGHKLTIKNAKIDMTNIKNSSGIYAQNGDVFMESVEITNFNGKSGAYPIVLFGEGDGYLKDVTVTGSVLDNADDLWIGDARSVTIDGGSYSSVFANSSEGSGTLRAALVMMANNPSITTLKLETCANATAALSDYAVNTVYMSAVAVGSFTGTTEVSVIDDANLTEIPGTYFYTDRTITLHTEVTLPDMLRGYEDLTINGNRHTISYAAPADGGAKVNRGIRTEEGSTLTINNANLDCSNLDRHGIYAKGAVNLNGVTIVKFDGSADATEGDLDYPIVLFGGGEATLTNVTVSDAKLNESFDYAADLWVGDRRSVTINGGSYNKIYVNCSEGSGTLSAGKVNFTGYPTVTTLTLEAMINTMPITVGETTYAAGQAYMHATYTGSIYDSSAIVSKVDSLATEGLTDLSA